MTTEERATAYAEKKMCAALDLKPDCINHTDALIPKFCGSDIEEAYLAGVFSIKSIICRIILRHLQ